MRHAALAVALAALALAAVPSGAAAKRVRVFAVGPRVSLDWVDSVQHFHDKLFALIDARLRGAGKPTVARGASDVASHLRPDGRNLVALPEDLGLMAAFTGSRGAPARASKDIVSAIIGLLGTYAPQMSYYTAKYPSLLTRPLPTRQLALALTDTFARAAVETYSELAARYHVWLEGGVTMAQSWQKVCLAAAPGCDEVSPAKVALLRSPDERNRDYAYEATSDRPSNMALLFDPAGRLVSKQIKSYLTPVELPSQLDLVPGDVMHGLSAVDTAVGRLGFVTSKDAWMPDLTERLDEAGVQILVQPEFFVGDTIRPSGPWAPDNIQGAGYSDVLRWPSLQALVLPQLTGNVFDLSADSQQAIVVKPRRAGTPAGRLLGQPAAAGFAAVASWVVEDPVREPYAMRRLDLGREGLKLLPDSKVQCADARTVGACRGGQREGVTWHDVTIGRPAWHPRRARGAARPLARARGQQRNVALAASGHLVVAAFEQDGRVRVARSTDGGRRWRAPVEPLRGERQWWPAVAVRGGEVWLAAQVGDHVVWTRSADGGASFGEPRSVAAPADSWRPSIAATGPGTAYLAWVDTRDRFGPDDLPQAAIYGAQLPGGAPARLDSTAAPNALAASLDNAWAPSVAARGGRVLLSWTDFRTYDWRIYARESRDGGASFAAERAVTDTPAGQEALDASPRSVAGGSLVAYTAWAKTDASARRPSTLYDIRLGSPGGRSRRIDGSGARPADAFAPAVAPAKGGPLVAWQDMRRGVGEIRLVHSGRVRMVAGGRTGNRWRPALAVSGGRALVAWEDSRDGPSQVYVRRMSLPLGPSRP